jgi:eukaryotic-like serine/threonine-protein kinase
LSNQRSDGSSAGTFFLGRYRVVDEIGVGGMASVHLARMDGPGGFQKWVAIKRIHSHLIEDESFVQMFLDEASLAARISHPNVATVFDLGTQDDSYWIAMEYLHGEPLREIMRKSEETGHPMPPEIACRIIADAALGLHAAHELTGKNGEKLGVVHRDVTPHNLFVTYDGMTKVVDFGIAKFSSRLSSSTRAGTLKGKLAYMSPEQVHGEAIDRRTDIFALGVVLWELTTGRRLFRTDNDLDTLAKVQECNIPRPSSIIRGYPMDLEKVVLKALVKNRAERFQTASEFSKALAQFFLRRGLNISNEEVAACMHSAFHDRMASRDEHLRWAAEATQTVDVDKLKKDAKPSPSRPPPVTAFMQPPAAGKPAVRLDDDEAHPTVVPSRPAPPRPLSPPSQQIQRMPTQVGMGGAPPPSAGGPPRPLQPVNMAPQPSLPKGAMNNSQPLNFAGTLNLQNGFSDSEEPQTMVGKSVRGAPATVRPRVSTITGGSIREAAATPHVPNLSVDEDDDDHTMVDQPTMNLDDMMGASQGLFQANSFGPPPPLPRSDMASSFNPQPQASASVQISVPPPASVGPARNPPTMRRMDADLRTVTGHAVRQRKSVWLAVALVSAGVAVLGLITLAVVLFSGPATPSGKIAVVPSASTSAQMAQARALGPFGAVRSEFQTVLSQAPVAPTLLNTAPELPREALPEPAIIPPAPIATVAPQPVAAAVTNVPVALAAATPVPVPAAKADPPKVVPAAAPSPVKVPTATAPTPVGGTGYLTVLCLGTACTQVLLDGSPISAGNVSKHPVSSGRHTVKLVRPGGVTTSLSTTVEPGVTAYVRDSK